jgi:hypothetical protein
MRADIPLNYPLLQAYWKMAPALAAGCTIVMKPSEDTPLTTIQITELAEEACFPKGVVNLVLGPGPTVGNGLGNQENERDEVGEQRHQRGALFAVARDGPDVDQRRPDNRYRNEIEQQILALVLSGTVISAA